MREAVSLDAEAGGARRLSLLASRARAAAPTLAEISLALLSSALLVLSFPDFDLWPLAWVALAPLLYAVARRPRAAQSFLLGLAAGTLFFYASCHWLTFPMINYAGIPAWLAYILFLPAAAAGGLFPALFALALSRACARWGASALALAPPLWAASEWARLGAIGQLWNAVGYSQAFEPALIQAASFGGVYAVGFLVVTVNAALAYALARRDARGVVASISSVALVALVLAASNLTAAPETEGEPTAVVVAIQPNVIPDFNRPAREHARLRARHFELSAAALDAIDEGRGVGTSPAPPSSLPRVVVWPESPMNFSFARDAGLREEAARFARERGASLVFNSLEPAPGDGGFNAAVLVNQEGRLAVQYDKIRLMPFGEYVPLPRWMPGAELVRGIVGDFTPGARYTLMPLGPDTEAPRAGVFICLESAYPYITRRFADEGADVLIEMTNDAYQGDTAVMRQHLSNAVFRAVETRRTLLRVTNTGVSARVTPRGEVLEETGRFEEAVRVWPVARSDGRKSFYVSFGDAFAAACALVSLASVALSFRRRNEARA